MALASMCLVAMRMPPAPLRMKDDRLRKDHGTRDRDHAPSRSNDAALNGLHGRWADLIILG
jgi:hypothetical protein